MSQCPYCTTDNAADAEVCHACSAPMSNSQLVTQRSRPKLDDPPMDGAPDPPGTEPVDHIRFVPVAAEAGEPEAIGGPLTGSPVTARSIAAAAAAAPVRHATAAEPDAVRPRLRVIRGLKVNSEYPIYDGQNLIGRPDDRPVDIDIEEQEPADRIWSSRQHAVITCESGKLAIEDLNSLNGTFVNRQRIHPGRKRSLLANDVVTIGTIHLKVIV